MKKLLSILGFLAITSTPFISPLQVSTGSTEIKTEDLINNYQLIELEKQKATIKAFAEYNQELYIGMFYSYLAKMNFDGKITQVPIEGKNNKIILSIKEFNGNLYLSNTNQILQMTPDGKINVLLEGDMFDQFNFLEVFNNELYFTFSPLLSTDGSSLVKINSDGDFRNVLNFKVGSFPSAVKAFNNHLYFVTWNGNVNIISKMDTNGQVTELHQIDSSRITNLVSFNKELYLSLENGSVLAINANNELKTVVARNLETYSNKLVVFRDELYLGNSNKLEKLTSDNKIKTVVQVRENIQTLTVFKNELYIGMLEGYFAKLI